MEKPKQTTEPPATATSATDRDYTDINQTWDETLSDGLDDA